MSLPFASLLLAIAVCPLLPKKYVHWWEKNRYKFLVSAFLSLTVLAYYGLRDTGISFGHGAEVTTPGWPTVSAIIHHSLLGDYIPFIVLLFCLYTVAGGIRIVEDIPAHPLTNTLFLGLGAVLANVIGTTGASMLLIRPLLQINSERTKKTHTVVFFIFLVSNIGGCLTPIGDPPLFLGYLHGVPFTWTFTHLWPMWLVAVGFLLSFYYLWDHHYWYRHEPQAAIALDEATRVPLKVLGSLNLLFLGAIMAIVILVIPGQPLFGTSLATPMYVREVLMLICAAAAYLLTDSQIRQENGFTFGAIAEVAALFFGIFVTMTVPMELLRNAGEHFHFTHPAAYFWASGSLSSFLDNAPTYLIFFALGQASSEGANAGLITLHGGQQVLASLLTAVSLGSVFMGAMTYIGNGPNFMVKNIAESSGVKMPSFFGYMAYSCAVLLPLFVILTLVFFRY